MFAQHSPPGPVKQIYFPWPLNNHVEQSLDLMTHKMAGHTVTDTTLCLTGGKRSYRLKTSFDGLQCKPIQMMKKGRKEDHQPIFGGVLYQGNYTFI